MWLHIRPCGWWPSHTANHHCLNTRLNILGHVVAHFLIWVLQEIWWFYFYWLYPFFMYLLHHILKILIILFIFSLFISLNSLYLVFIKVISWNKLAVEVNVITVRVKLGHSQLLLSVIVISSLVNIFKTRKQ